MGFLWAFKNVADKLTKPMVKTHRQSIIKQK